MTDKPIILVIANDPVRQRAMRRYLQRAGYSVRAAADIFQATREAARSPRLDAVVTAGDLVDDPGHDLADVVHRLHPRAMIVACSTWNRRRTGRDAPITLAGVDACVSAADLTSQLLPALAESASRGRSGRGGS